MQWPTGMREHAYSLRASGMTTREIAAALPERFPNVTTPDHVTVSRWLQDPEASALVKQAETRIRATAAAESLELVPLAYAGLRDALAAGDLKSADAGSRVIVNLTRGFVQERVEVTTNAPETDDELAALLNRHGVKLGSSASNA